MLVCGSGDFYAAICIACLASRASRERNPRRDEWPDSFLWRSSKNMRIDLCLQTAELFFRDTEITENLKTGRLKALKLGSSPIDRVETRQSLKFI